MKNIKVLISAPSDQSKEVEAVLAAISDFNDLMLKRGITFSPVYWQKNIATGRGERGQDVINDQISDCDMIIAIVGTRMGTETGRADSGTAEEVFDFCKNNNFINTSYNTHVFFNTHYDGDVLTIDPEQLTKVQKFKGDIIDLGVLYALFSNTSTLNKLITMGLDAFYFESEQTKLISLEETELEELGLDDYVENTVEDLQFVSSLIADISDSMSNFSQEASMATTEKDQKAIISKGVEAMNKFSGKISDKVTISKEHLDSAYLNLNGALKIAIADFLNEQNLPHLVDLTDSLRGMIDGGKEAQRGIQILQDSIEKMPRRNKALIKAKRKLLLPIMKLNKSLLDFNYNSEIIVTEVEGAMDDFLNNLA